MKMFGTNDSPGVVAPPPLVFASGLIAGGLLTWLFPVAALPALVGYVIGGVLVVSGVGMILSIHLTMKKAKTNIEPWKPTTTIIKTGFYGYSRNPIYVGMAIIYIGVAAMFGLVWSLAILPLCILFIHFLQILPEEKYLEAKFGSSYIDYKSRVRRWV